jgi:hypothetical protein
MKPRHAAALALVGWYLMTPPVSDHGAIIYQDAPLSQWTKAQLFDSESDCEAKRKEAITDSQEAADLVPDSDIDKDDKQDATDAASQTEVSRCVAADDPALGSSAPSLGPSVLKKLLH